MRRIALLISLLATALCSHAQVFAWYDPVSHRVVGIPNNFPGNVTIGAAILVPLANEGATGTALNKLAKLTGAPSSAIIAGTSDTNGIIGIVSSGAGTTGNAGVARFGVAPCVFDGATTAGHYVQISATVAGDCHDAGAAYPTSGQIIGFVLSTNGGGGTYSALIRPDIVPGGGGGDTWRAGLCMAGVCNGDTANGRWLPSAATPKQCSLTASTAPSGSGISVDVLKNGTTSIFSSPIALAAAAQSAVVTSFAATTFNTTTDYATVALTGTTGSGVVISCNFQ